MAEHNLQKDKAQAVVFTDLVDSGSIRRDLGIDEAQKLENKHRDILIGLITPPPPLKKIRSFFSKKKDIEREIIDGEQVRVEGDSYIFCFPEAVDAIKFALMAQAEHRKVRKEKGYSKLHRFRAGIHFGIVRVKKKGNKTADIWGAEADLTARIMNLAQGNQILCSGAVYNNAQLHLIGKKIKGISGQIQWKDYGSYKAKGGDKKPIEIYEIGEKNIAPFKKPKGSPKIWPVHWWRRAFSRWDVRFILITISIIGYITYNIYILSCLEGKWECKKNGETFNFEIKKTKQWEIIDLSPTDGLPHYFFDECCFEKPFYSSIINRYLFYKYGNRYGDTHIDEVRIIPTGSQHINIFYYSSDKKKELESLPSISCTKK